MVIFQFSSDFIACVLVAVVIYSGRATLAGKRRQPVIEIATNDSLKVTWNLSKQSDPPTFLTRILSI